MNFSTERENNIIKNIAKEIVVECGLSGFEVSQELADTLVKLKLLNPKNGFTASEVMPRSLTQQLVKLVIEDLKQDTPAMNCIRMQVYWESVKMNVVDLKKEFLTLNSEKTDSYLNEILNLDREDVTKIARFLAVYTLCGHSLGLVHQVSHVKETIAAINSVFKYRDPAVYHTFHNLTNEQKIERVKTIAKTVAGVRLYLKYLGKAGEGIHEVNDLPEKLEALKKQIAAYEEKVTTKIDDIREVISSVVPMDYFLIDVTEIPTYLENLPPECNENDVKYLKKVLAIMLQHRIYLSDISSKLEEIDGDANFFLQEFNDTLQRLQATIRERDAVPTTEVFDEFIKASELWMEIQSYLYCLKTVNDVVVNLENINKKEHFAQTTLEKALPVRIRGRDKESRENSYTAVKESEDFHVEFNGYCAWTLYYNEGFLVPIATDAGLFQFQDQYYGFSNKSGHDLWKKDPQYCLGEIYEYLRNNPELVFLLNAYDNLYSVRTVEMTKKIDRKAPSRKEGTQTDLHPIEEYWDKDYTFSIWELKKQALALSRLVKCVTKSVQTTSPHSHFRASIGVLASPDKDKEAQTRKDSSCNHPAISSYLYGLRGQREDKFCIVQLTRPIDESCERVIVLKEGDPCRERRMPREFQRRRYWGPPCPSLTSEDKSDFDYEDSSDYLNKFYEGY